MKRKLYLGIVFTLFFGIVNTFGQNCNGFRTYTMGGWGTNCNGGNPGCYRDANFASAFPTGLTIGCGSNTISLTSSAAVAEFLPSGSTPRALDAGNLVNPGQSYNNVLAGQLVGVMLAAGFDAYDPNFSSNTQSFSSLIITQGPFTGLTVSAFLTIANNAIGGCATGYSFSALNATATAINENYDNGTVNNGFLTCIEFKITNITVNSNVTCNAHSNGVVTVSVTGGTAPYVYTLSNSVTSGSVSSQSYSFSGLAAGTYSVTVADSNGYIATGNTSFTVTQPSPIMVATSSTNVSCFSGNNGSATVSNISGGVAPYSILWANGSTANTISNLTADTYTGIVTDANGCSKSYSVTVMQPTLLITSEQITNVSCNGGNNGIITVTPSGGTSPYSILWLNGSTSFTQSNLAAGNYSAVVTDANGCQTSVSSMITQPDAISISISSANVLCFGGTAVATAVATGGTPNYSYSWNTNPIQTNSSANLPVGTWTVTVIDANGCISSANVTVILQSCEGFTTVTQGGYGAKCAGNNWGCYVKNNFSAAFPLGVQIGSNGRFLRFTSASAIQGFLPSGTTARALNPGILTNPTSSTYKNILAGQTLTLTLSLGFDANPTFSSSTIPLGSLIVVSGPFSGMTVNQLLATANTILGGGSSSYTASQINDAIDSVNRNYDNGTVNLGFLSCPCPIDSGRSIATVKGASSIEKISITIAPNPVKDFATIDFNLPYDSNAKISIYNINGQLISTMYDGEIKSNTSNEVIIDRSILKSGVYILKFETDKEVINKNFLVQ